MKNEFKVFFKKHQKITVSLLFVLIIWLGEISVYFVSNSISLIQTNRDMIRDNREDIQDILSTVKRNEAILQQSVTRNSFNSFIKRVDQDRQYQVNTNTYSTKQISELKGKLDVLEKFIYDKKN